MNSHGTNMKPAEIGNVEACDIDDDEIIVLLFDGKNKGKVGVSFNEKESAIIMTTVGTHIADKIYKKKDGD